MNKGWIYLAGAGILAFAAKNILQQALFKKATPAQQAFLNSVNKYSADIEKIYGIKPVILLSQASLESGFGTSGLARNGMNLFGIKVSKQWEKDGKPVWTGVTHEFVNGVEITITDKFKKYGSWKESIYDWAELISGIYKTAYGFAKTGNVASYGQAIVNTGYSTHPQYASLLTKVASQIA
jgi:flagellum-specific peptidoglycan hydrolase FlgJ